MGLRHVNPVLDIQQRLRSRAIWIQTAAGVAILGLVAPVAIAAMKAALAVAVVAALLVLTVVTGPLWAMKIANWTMKAVIAEATRNPIETRWSNYAVQEKNLQKFADQIQLFDAKLITMLRELTQLEKDYPNDPETAPFRQQYDAMKVLNGYQKEDYQTAAASLAVLKRTIEKMERMYSMALTANAAGASANAKLTVLQEVAEKSAIAAVDNAVAMSMAQLQRRILERVPERKAIPVLTTPVVEGKVIARQYASH